MRFDFNHGLPAESMSQNGINPALSELEMFIAVAAAEPLCGTRRTRGCPRLSASSDIARFHVGSKPELWNSSFVVWHRPLHITVCDLTDETSTVLDNQEGARKAVYAPRLSNC